MKISSITQNFQKENNLAVVLRALRANDGCTRIRLADLTGLTQPSITKIVAQLIEWGAVSEQASVSMGVGRRATPLHLNSDRYRAAAVRINRKYINIAIYDMDGRLYDMARCETNSQEGARHCVSLLVGLLKNLIARSEVPVSCIGVAVPGPYNCTTGRISLTSGFPGWNEIDIRAELESAFSLPTFIDHDANCGALAEVWYAQPKEDADMLFICVDRAIGAGLILDSSVYRGKNGFAGEIGHASINIFGPLCECGNRGCLELYGSSIALEITYRQESFDPMSPASLMTSASAKEILALVRDGDPVARRAYTKTVTYLCFGVINLINTLNPDVVVFSDQMVNGGDLFLEVVNKTFRQYLMPEIYDQLRVKVCTLDGDPMLLGAAVLAFDRMLETPSSYFRLAKEVCE